MINVYSKWGMVLALVGATCSMQVSAQAISFDNSDTQDVVFPDMDRAWLKSGAIMDPMHVRSMGLGLTKNQVRSIIQYPHFSEGLFGPKQWDYIFNFKKPDGSYLTCQYQVHFDEYNKTKGTYWNTPECARFVNPAQKQPAHNVSLGADGLFAFGKSSLNDLQPEGRMKLERLSQQIRKGYNLESIAVTGHTDRIGSAASNLMLSQARANTVKAYLVAQGVPAHLITATGVGSTQPLATCNGPKSASVIACLQQNRRVEIAINGSVKQ